MLQIVDVDAARSNPQRNEQLIKQLIKETDVPIQVAGGIRTLSQINDWFETGAARVVLGTVAITYSPLVAEAFDADTRSYSVINWGLCPTPSVNRADALFYTDYRHLGDGVLEITYYFY